MTPHKKLEDKIRNHTNTTSIMNTHDYVLYEDAVDVLNEVIKEKEKNINISFDTLQALFTKEYRLSIEKKGYRQVEITLSSYTNNLRSIAQIVPDDHHIKQLDMIINHMIQKLDNHIKEVQNEV